MPKTKKEKDNKKAVGGHKAAVKEQVLDEPSRVGSSAVEHEKETAVNTETRRYASITGDTTPPRENAGEKV
jgi:ATP-binding cassette subfamily G (WHITE) protein 2 (PDR)